KHSPGRPRKFAPSAETRLRAQLSASSDATLPQHNSTWAEAQGTSLSRWTMSRAIARLRFSRNKSLSASERDPWARAAFQVQIAEHNAYQLVIIDEFGCDLDLSRRYTRAPIGERACGSVPRNMPANQTIIASLHPDGMGPSM